MLMTAVGASRPLARVPAKVPSLNAPAVTQTWWCEPLLMRRRGRWLPLPAFSSSLSYYDGCVALAARPICCRAYATISVPTLIVASTRRARSTRAGARTARKSRSASPPAAGHSAAAELSAPANNRWLAGCAVARADFPVLCRDTGTEAGALHQRPAVRGQLVSEDDARCSFNRAPRWVLVRCSLSLSPCPTVLLLRRRRPALPSLNRRRSSERDTPW
jgi:hypothetical protein